MTNKSLGEIIGDLRNADDLSLRELAKQLGGVTAAHLSDIELGRRHPSDDLLIRIAKFFRVSADKLRSHDTRPPVDDIKRRANKDPEFGFALRTLVGKNIKTEDLLKWLNNKDHKK